MMNDMRDYFFQLADRLGSLVQDGERGLLWLSSEQSDFVRVNHSAIRQPGCVTQHALMLELVSDGKHAQHGLQLTRCFDADCVQLDQALSQLRTQLFSLQADPHLLLPDTCENTQFCKAEPLPPTQDICTQILAAANDQKDSNENNYDMVGFLAAGQLRRGFADTRGQRNWYESANFSFDWSLYHNADKAVKTTYAGFKWEAAAFRQAFSEASRNLQLLARPPVTVPSGAYRVYLAPCALGKLVGMLNWDGFSERAQQTRQSSLRRMRAGEASLHPQVSMAEVSTLGIAPAFQEQGFVKPDVIPLIRQGQLCGSLISPASAKEFGLAHNGADAGEKAVSLVMEAGQLPRKNVLRELGTGIYISNLWYLNYSDRTNCCITGMTRFACFWVENGEIVAPLNVMRFDDSLYNLLGTQLLHLTQERDLLPEEYSVEERHTGGSLVPGALIRAMRFVL